MKLYIRHRQGIWINFIQDLQSLSDFESMYIKGTPIVIGDLSTFNKYMKLRLLKFLEENPEVDCYSSQDLSDPILLSRFVEIIKEPQSLIFSHSLEEFQNSNRDYTSVLSLLSNWSNEAKLRAPFLSDKFLSLLNE